MIGIFTFVILNCLCTMDLFIAMNNKQQNPKIVQGYTFCHTKETKQECKDGLQHKQKLFGHLTVPRGKYNKSPGIISHSNNNLAFGTSSFNFKSPLDSIG